VRVVVADTGPLNYLAPIEAIELLPRLFGTVLAPETVLTELKRPGAPTSVRAWLATNPPWLKQRATPPVATLRMKVEDLRPRGAGWQVQLHEKGGKQHAIALPPHACGDA
jgi:hypothetical protein